MKAKLAIQISMGLGGYIGLAVLASCGAADGETQSSAPEESVGEAQQEVGEGGVCNISMHCDPGLACCFSGFLGHCRDLQTDENNCGSCGTVCGGSDHCSSGHCCGLNFDWEPDHGQCLRRCGGIFGSCTGGKSCCSGFCVDLTSDFYNCGSCGNECNSCSSCSNSSCLPC